MVVGSTDHKDTIKILVEALNIENELEKTIAEEAKAELKLRTEVEIVAKDTIPNDGLVIEDTRTYE